MRLPFALLAAVLAVSASACGGRTVPPEDAGPIEFVRNSEFVGPHLRVFITQDDGPSLSVNTADDAVQTSPGQTPLPGHQARNWVFVKDEESGTSVVYALVSWNPLDTPEYLMAGWWAYFPDQHLPSLSFANSRQYSIVDGPELEAPDVPVSGQASYVGQAGGLYNYRRGRNWGELEGSTVVEEWEGHIALTADFSTGTVSGCIGCEGDLATRRAHFRVLLGNELTDTQQTVADYELHLGAAPISPEGTISHPDVTVRHPTRGVTASEGHWGGSLSNRPDGDGNPRLAAGFVSSSFTESDGSAGAVSGVFVAPSATFGSQAIRSR